MEAEIALRWTPSAEEFQEGIIPREFCHKIKVCKEGQQDINEMIARSDRRQKDLDEEKADKERAKARKAQKAAAKTSKAEEEDEDEDEDDDDEDEDDEEDDDEDE